MVQYIPYSVASRLIMAESIVSSECYTIIDLSNALAKAFSIQAFAMVAAIPFTLIRGIGRRCS